MEWDNTLFAVFGSTNMVVDSYDGPGPTVGKRKRRGKDGGRPATSSSRRNDATMRNRGWLRDERVEPYFSGVSICHCHERAR